MSGDKEMPLGLGMALAQNKQALFYFSRLDEASQQELISRVHSVNSKEEMKEFVEKLAAKEEEAGSQGNKSFT